MFKKIALATTAASTSFFLTASSILAQGAGGGTGSSDSGGSGAIKTAIKPTLGFAQDFGKLINNILSIIMVVALLLVLLYLVLGGIEWITSGGDKGKTESARNKITAAIIGIIILAASYALVSLVALVLGFTSFSDAVTGIPQLNK